MNNLPLVSVAIPCYNHDQFVQQTIQSVIDQDYNNIELIIIDDGSKDSSVEAIQRMVPICEKRFKRFEFRRRANKGLSATLNEMIEWSEGKYFSACASDDILLSFKMTLLIEQMESIDDNYAVAFGDAIFINDNNQELFINKKTGKQDIKENGTQSFLDYHTFNKNFSYKNNKLFGTYKSLLEGNYLPAMSNIIKLEKIKEVGAWTNDNTIEDWEIWLKLSKKYKFILIDEPVALYRLHDNNSVKKIRLDLIKDSIKLLENEKRYSFDLGYKKILYKNLARTVIDLKNHNLFLFFKYFLINSLSPYFILSFLNIITRKLITKHLIK